MIQAEKMHSSYRELRELRVLLPQVYQRVSFMWRGQPVQQLRLDCQGLLMHLHLRFDELRLAVAHLTYMTGEQIFQSRCGNCHMLSHFSEL